MQGQQEVAAVFLTIPDGRCPGSRAFVNWKRNNRVSALTPKRSPSFSGLMQAASGCSYEVYCVQFVPEIAWNVICGSVS